MSNNTKEPTLPPMNWTDTYICPRGHFYIHGPSHSNRPGMAPVAMACDTCTKESGHNPDGQDAYNFTFYSMEEWINGSKQLRQVATEINTKFLGKPAKCDICNKVISAEKDKAYHLQKHSRMAITLDDSHFLKAVE